MDIKILPLLQDNFCYLIILQKQALLVDPAKKKPVLEFINQYQINVPITHILISHNHIDHAEEAVQLADHLSQTQQLEVIVVNGKADNQSQSQKYTILNVQNEKNCEIINNDTIVLKAQPSPCHTRDHVLYLLTLKQSPQQIERNVLFTGDTLFNGGCGRFFEGSADEMLNNMNWISSLKDSTEIYCGHEYTLQNLEWARQVDLNNEALQKKYEWVKANPGQCTVPSTVLSEKLTNVFMRCNDEHLQEMLGTKSNPIQTMNQLRQMKNQNATLMQQQQYQQQL